MPCKVSCGCSGRGIHSAPQSQQWEKEGKKAALMGMATPRPSEPEKLVARGRLEWDEEGGANGQSCAHRALPGLRPALGSSIVMYSSKEYRRKPNSGLLRLTSGTASPYIED